MQGKIEPEFSPPKRNSKDFGPMAKKCEKTVDFSCEQILLILLPSGLLEFRRPLFTDMRNG